MAKVDKNVLESMARIGFAEKPFVDWVDAKIADTLENMIHQTDEVQLRILQGRAQAYGELKKLIKEAPDVLRKA